MFCSKCGNSVPDTATVCTHCGAPIGGNGFNTTVPIVANNYSSGNAGTGLCVASLVMGILSLLLFCFSVISVPLAIASLITGCVGSSKAKRAGRSRGMGTAGIICSVISLLFVVLIFFLVILLSASPEFSYFMEEFFEEFYYALY